MAPQSLTIRLAHSFLLGTISLAGIRFPVHQRQATSCAGSSRHCSHTCAGVGAGNSRHLQTLLLVCSKLLRFLGEQSPSTPAFTASRKLEGAGRAASVLTVNDFLFTAGLDDINMFRLIRCLARPE